jgi:integrase/recombinase XerD
MTTIQENQIKDFKSYLAQLGYSTSSCYMLPDCIKDFLEYHNGTGTSELNAVHIHQFYEWLQIRPNRKRGGGLSESYVHHHVYGLRIFFNWLEETGEITYNPMSVLKFKSPESGQREPLTQVEIRQLLENCISLKETAILHLFYSCGLRRSEGEALNIWDIHFKKQILYVREGKGARRRAIPMTAKVSHDLESYYLHERAAESKVKDTEAFILNKKGWRMSGDSYNKILKAILQRAAITKEASLHHLRHSIATHLLESGLELEKVRDFLGHSHLETTQIYTKVNERQLNKLLSG